MKHFWIFWLLIASSAFAQKIPTAKTPLRAEEDAAARQALQEQVLEDEKLRAEKVKPHPTAADFPGVPAKDAPRVSRSVRVDPKVPGWHSTGLYAGAGQIVTVTIPDSATKLRLNFQIGSHKDRLWALPQWKRVPQIVRSWPLKEARSEFASAFGGLIYVVAPQNASAAPFDVTISNAVEAPLFELGKTSLEQWRRIRNRPAPWAEIGSEKIIFTVPSKEARELDDPVSLMKFWDKVADAHADLAAIPRERARPERYVADVQISAGYMHSGYPIMTHLDAAPRMVDLNRLQTKGDWGMFHELGHNHQRPDWTFAGTGEVTCNLFSLYDLETLCPGAPVHQSIEPKKRAERRAKYFADGAKFDEWKSDPFLALSMYCDLKDAFGWDAYKKVFAEYRELSREQRPKNDDEKRDQWMVRFSRTVGKNLGPFFVMWGVPTSEAARDSIKNLPVWMPPYAKAAKGK